MRLWALLGLAVAIAACTAGPTSPLPTTLPGTTAVPTTATSSPVASTTAPATTVPPPTTIAPSTTATSGIEIEIEVAGGEVVTGGGRHVVPLDADVVLTVTSDMSDEVHIHGYDLSFDVEAGVESSYEFTADVPGIFEVELEHTGLPLVELEVRP